MRGPRTAVQYPWGPCARGPVDASRSTARASPRFASFHQGLEFRGSILYESTGLVGRSFVRAGLPGKPPTMYADLPAPHFGEGITLAGDKLWQLTWRDGIAIERDHARRTSPRHLPGRGVGPVPPTRRRRQRLVMSDGTDRLTFRDPDTFTATGSIDVRRDGRPVTRLNDWNAHPTAPFTPTSTTLRATRSSSRRARTATPPGHRS
ncbi:glutaminyl-peptide cyclotransferase [Streptomyces sp. NPDC006540]|uniref:glutaminyl-peptide cyclotransferase n=1 Tax=Streptomyces sp. NPDC006540 TaxID=3155353 RepID=UPI0033AA41C2